MNVLSGSTTFVPTKPRAHARMHTPLHTHIDLYTHTHTPLHTHTYTSTHTHLHLYIHTHTPLHIHTYTLGVPRDREAAREWWEHAAELGNAEAVETLESWFGER